MAVTTVDDVDRSIVLSYASRIPWDKYVGQSASAGSVHAFAALTSQDVALIRRLGVLSPAALTEALNTEAEAKLYPQALLKVLMNITDVRIIQYALTLIVDCLETDPEKRSKLFSKPGSDSDKPYTLPFLQLVGSTGSGARIVSTEANPYVVEQAAQAASYLLAVDSEDHTAISSMLAWALTNLAGYSSTNPRQIKVTECAVSSLQILLRNDFLRTLFLEEHGVEKLVRMTASSNSQLVYGALFCLWVLSLNKTAAKQLERLGAVPSVCRIVRIGAPLKILRMGLGTLANVGRTPNCAEALTDLCESHIPELVSTLLNQDPKISDPELVEDLSWLSHAFVGHASKSLTSVERYERELHGRRLEWNTMHSTEFWKENAQAFESKDFKLIRALAAFLTDDSLDDTTLAIALHDLGEFAAYHPQGRAVLTSMGVRDTVLEVLSSREEEDDVKQQALLAMSKMMVQKWAFVSGQNQAAEKNRQQA